VFPWPFDPGWGFYYFCFGLAALATWMTANIAASRFGRALIAIRDAEVAAEASGIAKPRWLMTVFPFAGALAGIAGGLFSSLQSYITPDAFTFDLSILFFIAILIGGRGSILGPLLGTISLVDFSLCRTLAVDRAGGPRRDRRPAGLQEPSAT
jgi:branched-chain amino acid transport system permease protein